MTPQPAPSKEDRSLGDLLGELTQETITLIRHEFALAKAETTRNIVRAGKQMGLLAAGGALVYAGVLALIAALIILLDRAGMPLWGAALLVGILVIGAGSVLVMKGLEALKRQDLKPHKTLNSLEEIKEAMK